MALAIAAMAGCQTTSSSNTDSPNSASGSDGEQIKAVMVSVMNGGDYWGPIEEGFLETCESYGWTGEYWSPVTTNSGTEMVELIETAITQGYDVISTCVTDANIFSDVLTRAREAGITVIGTTAPAEGLLDAFVGFDQYQLGYNHGQFIGTSLFGGAGTIVGSALGCILFATITNALPVMGVSTSWQRVAFGLILVIALFIDQVRLRRTTGKKMFDFKFICKKLLGK